MASKKTKGRSASARSRSARRAGRSRPKLRPAASRSRRVASREVARPASRAKKPASRPRAPERSAAPPPVPNAMGLQVLHLDYTTHNFEEVRRFYTQQLGFTKFDYEPSVNYLSVQATNGASIGFMPPAPQMGPPMMPREPNLYFIVQDVDEAYRKLQTRGVSFEGPPENKPWGHRVVITRDPEGRNVWLAQKLQRS